MRKYFYLSVILLISAVCYSQQKKDSKIIAHITDTANLFNRLSSALYEAGYDLETNNPTIGFVSTKDKEMKKYAVKGKLRASIRDTAIIFTGQMRLSFKSEFGDMYTDVEYIGAKNSPMREVWNDMDSIAKQLGPVTYSK